MGREDVEDLTNMEWIDNIKEWCNNDLYSLTISENFGNKRLNLHWTPTGFQPMDPDDDLSKYECHFN